MPYPYPKVINFDGDIYPKVQQGAYWPGFRIRFVSGTDPENLFAPLAQVRTAPVDRNGRLLATMRAISEIGGWVHFDMTADITVTLPIGKPLFYDVDVTDDGGQQRTPITGRIDVIPEVSRVGAA